MNKVLPVLMGLTTVAMILWVSSCMEKATDIHGDHSEFEIIEHACLHMSDAGEIVVADSVMPGPHLDEEDFEHTRLKVVLVKRADDSTFGYIHVGPAITGDLFVMTSKDVPLAITNRTTAGDTELEIEETFTAAQIQNEASCSLIRKAIVFEAQTGGNIIKIGPTTFDTISVIIEEGSHEHSH